MSSTGPGDDGLTGRQRYRFDLDGYLAIEDVLGGSGVAGLNRPIDERDLPPPSRRPGVTGGSTATSAGTRRSRTCSTTTGSCRSRPRCSATAWLDRYYGIHPKAGAETLGRHGGGEPHDPSQFYYRRNDETFNGLTVVSWNLT